MEDLAAQIVADLAPADGWWKSDSEQQLTEVVLAMLEEMDLDSVEEAVTTIANVIRAEYGE